MKVTFISPYPDITAFGIRTMSAYLKRHGHKTQMIFMPDPLGDNLLYGVQRYKHNILDELITLCGSSDLIGITLMTNFFDNAVQITEKLKRELDIPVIWGECIPPSGLMNHWNMLTWFVLVTAKRLCSNLSII